MILRSALIEIDALIKRHGIIGYREEWSTFEFPFSTFLKLEHYMLEKQKYPVNQDGEETSSNLNSDLELLLQEII